MAFLTGTEYVTISNLISSARNQMQDSVGDIFDAVYEIVQMDSIDKEIDLGNPSQVKRLKKLYISLLQF